MSEIPIENNIIFGLPATGLIHPKQYLNFLFYAKNILARLTLRTGWRYFSTTGLTGVNTLPGRNS